MTYKKLVKLSLLGFVFLLGSIAFGGKFASANENKIKTVGYIQDYAYNQIEETTDFSLLTDLNYFSLVPSADGSLNFGAQGNPEQLKAVVEKAKENDVRISVAIGGWGLSDGFSGATSDANREMFIKNISNFVEQYDLDGVDIDWEYPSQADAKSLEVFLKELKVALGDKLVTICVPSGVDAAGAQTANWELQYTSEALNQVDWVNIMAYDAQVAGAPHHSPASIQKNSLMYWNNLMGGNRYDKLVAGVPFYARSEYGNTIAYSGIALENSQSLETDIFNDGSGNYYYNGKDTLLQKLTDSIELGSYGMMIWSPTQDAKIGSSQRLMDVIYNGIIDKGFTLDKGEEVPATELPTIPTKLEVKQASKKGVDLTWTKNSSKDQVSYYTIYRDGVVIGTSKTASYTDGNVSEDTIYKYQISATNSIGESEKTEALVVEVPVGEPEPEYPEWVINHAYSTGDLVSYKENVYKCIQSHESNEGWAPDLAPTLWELVVE